MTREFQLIAPVKTLKQNWKLALGERKPLLSAGTHIS